jgi:hypothetical protein
MPSSASEPVGRGRGSRFAAYVVQVTPVAANSSDSSLKTSETGAS